MRYFNRFMDVFFPCMIVFYAVSNVRQGDALWACFWGFLGGLYFTLHFDNVLDRYLKGKRNA